MELEKIPGSIPIPFKRLRPVIKTIVAYKAIDFDEKVNAELKDGWRIQKIKIDSADRIYYFAVLERLIEVED